MGTNRFSIWLRLGLPAILLLLCFSAIPFFLTSAGEKDVDAFKKKANAEEKEANEEHFKEAAYLEGNPVTGIELAESFLVNDSFLVTIKNKYPKITRLALVYVPISDDGLKNVSHLQELRDIELFGLSGEANGGLTSDKALENIKTLQKMEKLSFGQASITDKGIGYLKGWTELRELHIMVSPVSDESLKTIAKLPKLEKLSLSDTNVTANGMVHLSKMTNLTYLRARGFPTNDSLRSLSKLEKMEELSLEESLVTDEGLVHLKGLKSLRNLSLVDTKVTGSGLKDLPGSIKKLRLWGCPVSDRTAEGLSKLTNVEELNLNQTEIGDNGLGHLAKLTKLRELRLKETKVTDAGMAQLRKIENLEMLSLSTCRGITDKAVDEIVKMKNLKEIDLSFTNMTEAGLRRLREVPKLKIRD